MTTKKIVLAEREAQLEQTDLFIRRAYTYNGISVAVDIDLEKKTISLVEPSGDGDYKRKKWLFDGRGVRYMVGWQQILDTMKFAIAAATDTLKDRELEDEKKFQDLMIALAVDDMDHLPKLPKPKKGAKK